MKKPFKIAVTGAGGGVGQSIIKALYAANYQIVALDASPLAAGLYGASVAHIIPRVCHPQYIKSLLTICRQEKCRLLFPGLDSELEILSRNVDKFIRVGTTIVVSKPEVIEACNNKLITHKLLSSHGISVAKTSTLQEFLSGRTDMHFPIIIKPMIGGSRSNDVHLLSTKKELKWLMQRRDFDKKNFIIQEYIEGDEFTCGSVNLDSKCWGVIVMRRTLRDGDTYKAFTVRDKTIEKFIKKIMDVLHPFGGCNVQLRVKEGVPYVLEVNARCSGTTAARSISGFNEPKMIADYLLLGKKPSYKIKKLTILRYWKEMVVDNKDIKALEKRKKLRRAFAKL